jgi:hypothetical protein
MKKPAIAMLANRSVKIEIVPHDYIQTEQHLELSVNAHHRTMLETIALMHQLGWKDYKSGEPLIVPHKVTVGDSSVESKAPIDWEIVDGCLKFTLNQNIYKNPVHWIDHGSLATAMSSAFSVSRFTAEELGTIRVQDFKLWVYAIPDNPQMYILTDRKTVMISCGNTTTDYSSGRIQVYSVLFRTKDAAFSAEYNGPSSVGEENHIINKWSTLLSLKYHDISELHKEASPEGD